MLLQSTFEKEVDLAVSASAAHVGPVVYDSYVVRDVTGSESYGVLLMQKIALTLHDICYKPKTSYENYVRRIKGRGGGGAPECPKFELTLQVAKAFVATVKNMIRAGFVHMDLNTGNICFDILDGAVRCFFIDYSDSIQTAKLPVAWTPPGYEAVNAIVLNTSAHAIKESSFDTWDGMELLLAEYMEAVSSTDQAAQCMEIIISACKDFGAFA